MSIRNFWWKPCANKFKSKKTIPSEGYFSRCGASLVLTSTLLSTYQIIDMLTSIAPTFYVFHLSFANLLFSNLYFWTSSHTHNQVIFLLWYLILIEVRLETHCFWVWISGTHWFSLRKTKVVLLLQLKNLHIAEAYVLVYSFVVFTRED